MTTSQARADSTEDPDLGHSTTLHGFVAQCQPLFWKNRKNMLLERWFQWPPDIFALTSLILDATGAYRRGASPPKGNQWPPTEWPGTAERLARQWRNWVADGCIGPNPLANSYITRLKSLGPTILDELYDCETDDSWELCQVLLELHGIADEAMSGVGIAFSPFASMHQVRPDKDEEVSDKISKFYLQANFLLTLRGSLSRLPKYRGIVLPKSRTPQVGLTLRSFSNNLTFHMTEVDVAWRAFPWLNTDENIVNVMVVPWPFEVEASSFKTVHPAGSSYSGDVRYFHYKPRAKGEKILSLLAKYLLAVQGEVRRVHVLVFPEMALGRRDLTILKRKLEAALLPNQMPMIISGVSVEYKEQDDSGGEVGQSEGGPAASSSVDSQTKEHMQHGPQATASNRVVLSLYYAGKWHDVVQDKHHRWRIDSQQIEQYGLGGVLSGGRIWWEALQVVRRRLSVLAANSWLTICPLICEDLARLDPVSDLIRGIGPSLLTAILFDGPQLKSRWSARYASVFADDPGSSVLTVTSLGMSKRSTPSGPLDHEGRLAAEKGSRTVALWRDQEKGWYPVSVDPDGFPVSTLTLSAILRSETSFDGRVDLESSAAFIIQGLVKHSIPGGYSGLKDWLEAESNEKEDGDEGTSEPFDEAFPEDFDEGETEPEEDEKERDGQRKKLKILDMCELTLLTYYVDAVVDHRSKPKELQEWLREAIAIDPEQSSETGSGERFSTEIISFLIHSIRKRDLVPREVPTPHLVFAVEIVTELVIKARETLGPDFFNQGKVYSIDNLLTFWRTLKDVAWEHIVDVCEKMESDLATTADVISELEKEISREGERLNSEAEKRSENIDRLKVHIRPYEVGRIMLMTPLSILWAAHARLSARRRFGVLTSGEVKLLKDVEQCTSGETFHGTYLKWRKMAKKKSPRE
ncbi:MAG: hypothetical protein K0U98_05095 [Deltaproteobacteria bacterium]|nr:hypothetical protein [Deltaproteobacteria bacterium]